MESTIKRTMPPMMTRTRPVNQQISLVVKHLLAPLLAALVALALWQQEARADDFFVKASFGMPQGEPITVNVQVGQSRVIRFDEQVGRFSVSDPAVAEAVLVAPDQVVVNGKASGQINFIAWDKNGERPIVFNVFVRVNLTLIDTLIRQLFPQDNIRLSQASGSVILSGEVSDVRKAAMAESAVQAAGFKTVNLLQGPIREIPQVQLQVKVAEVNRTRARELGTAYAYQTRPGVGGFLNTGAGPASVSEVDGGVIKGTINSSLNFLFLGGNLTAFIRALENKGALRTLSEPNMIAMDGAQASFLAGGEFPVPILQGSGNNANVTIIFKEYGVRLNFKPTIIDEKHIRLELIPEVSTLDFANGVRFGGFTIPALRSRRAQTSIELQDGWGFTLAGLLDNSETKSLQKVPLIGDVPVLGSLFRSTQFQRQETDLMFIVTVHLVRPASRDALPDLKGLEGLKSGSPLLDPPPQEDRSKPGSMPGDKVPSNNNDAKNEGITGRVPRENGEPEPAGAERTAPKPEHP